MSRRTQAAIAAGLLAFSTGGVPAAVASPPDEVTEGTSEVVAGGDPSSSVDFEPTGEGVQLPDEVLVTSGTNAPAADDEDGGPIEQEPATEVHQPVLEPNSEVVEPVARAAPSPEPAPGPTPLTPPYTPAAPEHSQPQQRPTKTGPTAEGGQRRQIVADKADDATQRSAEPSSPEPASVPRPAPVTPQVTVAEPTSEPAAQPAPAEPVAMRVVASVATRRASAGARFHTVRPGESLWSIAADLLGDRATVPRIAREVNRLWELNDERIGTGRPDLLFAGTRLRLR